MPIFKKRNVKQPNFVLQGIRKKRNTLSSKSAEEKK